MFLPGSLLLLILLLYASSTTADPLHIPLSRRASATEKTMDEIHADAEYIRAKYGYNKIDSRRAVSDIPITNQVITIPHYFLHCRMASLIVSTQYLDPPYYGALTIGTP